MEPDPSPEALSELVRENRRLREELAAAHGDLADLREQFALLARENHDPGRSGRSSR